MYRNEKTVSDTDTMSYGLSGAMPNGERQSLPQRLQAQSTSAAIDVLTLSAYDLVQHTYDGSHGYRDGTYLIPHPREAFYETRRGASYYINAYKPVIDAMVTPVYNQEIKRETADPFAEKFIENCDAAGTGLHSFMEVAIANARLFGVTFVVVENFKKEDAEEIEKDNLDKRKLPYIYERQPQTVKKHEVDERGNLVSIDFFEKCEKIGDEEVEIIRHWDSSGWRLYYEKSAKDGKKVEVEIDVGAHELGVLPVVPIVQFCKVATLKEMPNPPTYDLARLTHALFNKESQVVHLEHFQAFSQLVLSDYDQTNLSIGADTFINCSKDAAFAPQYISPNTANITTLIANCDRLKEMIYSLAGQLGVIGIKQETSGLAKDWDFRAEESVLKKTATVGEAVEYKLFDVFSKYLQKEINVEIVYPHEFGPGRDSKRIDDALKAIRETPPQEINAALWEEVVWSFWAKDKVKAKEIIDKMEIHEPDDDGTDPGDDGMQGDGEEEENQNQEMKPRPDGENVGTTGGANGK
jgi:hypothetical protein